MTYYVGLDVSTKETAICVMDEAGTRVWEGKLRTDPDAIAAVLTRRAAGALKIGIESGPMTVWLCHALTALEPLASAPPTPQQDAALASRSSNCLRPNSFVLLPQRWVIERSFAWTTRFRRLIKDDERSAQTLAGFHVVASACLMTKQAAAFAAGS